MSVALDHLVVAAATLEQGVAWCEATLGVTPGPGGTHPTMGTHNRLLALGDALMGERLAESLKVDRATGRERATAMVVASLAKMQGRG